MERLFHIKPVSDKWEPFVGHYEKEYMDIRLHNGEEILYCWPNAGEFHPLTKTNSGRQIPFSDVKEVRLTPEIVIETETLKNKLP